MRYMIILIILISIFIIYSIFTLAKDEDDFISSNMNN